MASLRFLVFILAPSVLVAGVFLGPLFVFFRPFPGCILIGTLRTACASRAFSCCVSRFLEKNAASRQVTHLFLAIIHANYDASSCSLQTSRRRCELFIFFFRPEAVAILVRRGTSDWISGMSMADFSLLLSKFLPVRPVQQKPGGKKMGRARKSDENPRRKSRQKKRKERNSAELWPPRAVTFFFAACVPCFTQKKYVTGSSRQPPPPPEKGGGQENRKEA